MSDHLKVSFLGTGAAAPSLTRGLPALAIHKEGKIVLCDCGEGTQMQIQRAGLPPTKIHTILISHLHGDHLFGLPGFISSQQLMGRTTPLTVYGPMGLKRFWDCFMLTSKYEPQFPFQVVELAVDKKSTFDIPGFQVTALNLKHSDSCLGYRLQEPSKPGAFDAHKAERLNIPNGEQRAALQRGEDIVVAGRVIQSHEIVGPSRPGRIIAYCTDTRPCDAGIELARNCDLLIHDATFSDAYADRAEPTMHSTGREAARLAKTSGAKKMALWHLSIRLRGEEELNLLEQAQKEFPHSFLPEDLSSFTIPRSGDQDES